MTEPTWQHKFPARWFMPPSYGSGDRQLILIEVLFIPIRWLVAPLIALYRALGFLLERITA